MCLDNIIFYMSETRKYMIDHNHSNNIYCRSDIKSLEFLNSTVQYCNLKPTNLNLFLYGPGFAPSRNRQYTVPILLLGVAVLLRKYGGEYISCKSNQQINEQHEKVTLVP